MNLKLRLDKKKWRVFLMMYDEHGSKTIDKFLKKLFDQPKYAESSIDIS